MFDLEKGDRDRWERLSKAYQEALKLVESINRQLRGFLDSKIDCQNRDEK